MGIYERLRSSSWYDFYCKIADPKLIENKLKEVEFYRSTLLGLKQRNLIFDIGANVGDKTEIFLRLGAKVVAVEPDRSNQVLLQRRFVSMRMAKKPVSIIPKAVAAESGLQTMWIDQPGSALNTLSPKWADVLRTDQRRFGTSRAFTGAIEVETTTLEELIRAYGRPFYIKVDVEGYEAKVLSGLKSIVPYISFEVNLPEFRQEAVECVHHLEGLARGGKYNYVSDCRQGLASSHWFSSGELVDTLNRCQESCVEVFWMAPPKAGAVRRGDNEERFSAIETKDPVTSSAQVAVLTGGGDRHYALGLAAALIDQGVAFDFIGSDELEDPILHQSPLVRFLNLRKGMCANVSLFRKVMRVLFYYWRLVIYAATSRPKVFHLLWNNKFQMLDRTLLMLFYRALGKRVALTVHNVNAGWRDNRDNFLNRLTLRIQYHLCDHLFVHTDRMKRELWTTFGVADAKSSIIPYGINNAVPNTGLTSAGARRRLGLSSNQKVLLFFGNIAPYKGLEYLVEAVALLVSDEPSYRLVIAGQPKGGGEYWDQVKQRIAYLNLTDYVIQRIEYVRDADTEVYFKAADLLVLPYTYIFQSGVLFLGYNFGLPAIATDVGSLKEYIFEGETGSICKPRDPVDLSNRITAYFSSELYRELEERRQWIANFASEKYSWRKVGDVTSAAYAALYA